MKYLLKNATVYIKGKLQKADVLVDGGIIADISYSGLNLDGIGVFDFSNTYIFCLTSKLLL